MNKIVKDLTLLLLAGALVACGGKSAEKQATTTKKESEKVKVQTLSNERIAKNLELSTTLEGYETMNISPSITGHIEHIYVEVGSRVQKGSMLVRMDQTQLNTTRINLNSTKVELDFGTVEVDAGGVELGLVHAHEHAAFLHTAAYFYVDVFDVAGDAGRDVHGFVAFEGGRKFQIFGYTLVREGLDFDFFGLLFGGGGLFFGAFASAGYQCSGEEQEGEVFYYFVHIGMKCFFIVVLFVLFRVGLGLHSEEGFEGYLSLNHAHYGLYVVALGGDDVGAGIGYFQIAGMAVGVFFGYVVEHAAGDVEVLILYLVVLDGGHKVVAQLIVLHLKSVLGLLFVVQGFLVVYLGLFGFGNACTALENRQAHAGTHHVGRGHVESGIFAEVGFVAVLIIGRQGRSVVHPGEGELLARELFALLEQFIVVVVFYAETAQGEFCGIVDVEYLLERCGEFQLCVDIGAKQEYEGVVEHVQRALGGVDVAAHRGHLHREFVGVDLLGGTGGNAGLSGGKQLLHVLQAGVKEFGGTLHNQDRGVGVLYIGAGFLLGLLGSGLCHIECYVFN